MLRELLQRLKVGRARVFCLCIEIVLLEQRYDGLKKYGDELHPFRKIILFRTIIVILGNLTEY